MRRPERMAEALREEITEIVGYELEDPRVQAVTVTDVRVSDDLRDASIFVVVEGQEEEIGIAMQALQHASSFVRQQVALNLDMRHAPHLHFARDTVEENAVKIEEVLTDLSNKEDFIEGNTDEE
ncbi:MAG: 30S ribosome-binding factor RbfA [Pyrinomonadaceae bacterium]|nr:30S ribosome-binding factor RbfA [Pyrinomonadaceae bacterium]